MSQKILITSYFIAQKYLRWVLISLNFPFYWTDHSVKTKNILATYEKNIWISSTGKFMIFLCSMFLLLFALLNAMITKTYCSSNWPICSSKRHKCFLEYQFCSSYNHYTNCQCTKKKNNTWMFQKKKKTKKNINCDRNYVQLDDKWNYTYQYSRTCHINSNEKIFMFFF